jgi:hypothetical protein
VRKAVGGKQRKIVHDTLPKDVPVISRGERRKVQQPTLAEQAYNRDHKSTDPCGQTKKQHNVVAEHPRPPKNGRRQHRA